MNFRSPTVTLTTDEGDRVRNLLRDIGIVAAAKALGVTARTVFKAAAESPISRLSAQVIRCRLETHVIRLRDDSNV